MGVAITTAGSRLSTPKGVCCCTSTTLRRYPPGGVPRTCLKALPSRRDTCIALPQRYIKSEDFEQCLESPRPYPQHDGMEQKNESRALSTRICQRAASLGAA